MKIGPKTSSGERGLGGTLELAVRKKGGKLARESGDEDCKERSRNTGGEGARN